jgi:hypothetical protein
MGGAVVRTVTSGWWGRSVIAVAAVAVALLAGGCSQKYNAERDGKDLGQAVCDLREASTQEEVDAAVAEVNAQLDDMAGRYTIVTAEDRADIDENLTDFAEHVSQGNELLIQQDLSVLERSVDNVKDDVNDVSEAAWDGFLQGLSECTQD